MQGQSVQNTTSCPSTSNVHTSVCLRSIERNNTAYNFVHGHALPDGVPDGRVGHDRLSRSDNGAGLESDANGLAPLNHDLLDVRLQLDPAAELLDSPDLRPASRRVLRFFVKVSWAKMSMPDNDREGYYTCTYDYGGRDRNKALYEGKPAVSPWPQ